jgi:hypothetical protein
LQQNQFANLPRLEASQQAAKKIKKTLFDLTNILRAAFVLIFFRKKHLYTFVKNVKEIDPW